MIKTDANAPAVATFYKDLLSEIKNRVRKAQNRLATVANTELLAPFLRSVHYRKWLQRLSVTGIVVNRDRICPLLTGIKCSIINDEVTLIIWILGTQLINLPGIRYGLAYML